MLIRRIIQVYSERVSVRQEANVFHSFAPCGDQLLCAFRRLAVSDRCDFAYGSAIMLQQFDPDVNVFLSEPAEIMNPGEDPRCIAISDRPFVLNANEAGYVLHDVQGGKVTNIIVDTPKFEYGKNWQPYVLEGELYVIHEFHPFRIIHIDVGTGMGRIVFEQDFGFGLKSQWDGYSCYRGGCSALNINGKITGFGHFNSDPGRHELFKWTFSPEGPELTVSFDIDVQPLREQGMAIFDPTCFFRFRNAYYLGLSCSNREWFYGQRFMSVLLELDDSRLKPKARKALLHRNYFRRAAELQLVGGRASSDFEVIAKPGIDPAGCVLRGGPQRIAPGRYALCVQYAVAGELGTEVGLVTVFAVRGRVSLATVTLLGSGGKLVLTDEEFGVHPADASFGLEVQIDWMGIADLRVTDVAIRGDNDDLVIESVDL